MSGFRVWNDENDPPGVRRGICTCGIPISIVTDLVPFLRLTMNHGETPPVSTCPTYGIGYTPFLDSSQPHPQDMLLLREALATAHG